MSAGNKLNPVTRFITNRNSFRYWIASKPKPNPKACPNFQQTKNQSNLRRDFYGYGELWSNLTELDMSICWEKRHAMVHPGPSMWKWYESNMNKIHKSCDFALSHQFHICLNMILSSKTLDSFLCNICLCNVYNFFRCRKREQYQWRWKQW